MNGSFILNGVQWKVIIVHPRDRRLIDRTNTLTLATCDPVECIIYISSAVRGDMFTKVLIHELGHCIIFTYGIDAEIRQLVKPEHWIQAEEWLCNFIYDYGLQIFDIMKGILGPQALNFLPQQLEKLIA